MVNISQVNSNTLQLNSINKLALQDFKVGQVLNAAIIKPVGNQLLLQIGAQTLLADTKLTNLTTGNLQVTVKQTQPTVILSINHPNVANQTATQSANQAIQNNINATLQASYRQALGQQLPVSQALNQMLTLPNLPIAIQSSIQLLLEQLLRPKPTLDGKELKQLTSQSGLFLEGNLKQGQSAKNANKDTKTQLLKLQQQTINLLQNTPNSTGLKQLNSLLTQALNKLTVQQLQLYETPSLINIELPMQTNSVLNAFRFEIYQHQAPNDQTWEVLITLSINNQQLDVKLQLNEERQQFACQIWCETATLEQQVRDNLGRLEKQFESLNLRFSNIDIVKKPFKASQFATKVALIDVTV